LKKNKDKKEKVYFGGQAVIEGVMMRGSKSYAIAVRNVDTKEVSVTSKPLKKTANGFVKLPIVRGVYGFITSMITGMKTIYASAEMAGFDDLEEENPSRFEKWLTDKFGDKLLEVIIIFAVVVAVAVSVLLFMVLPTFLAGFAEPIVGERFWIRSVIEGLTRLVLFLIYIMLISKMKDVNKLFAYHGAEHKTINCYEAGEELTTENVRKHSRLHKRCGTSFLLIVMIVAMVVFFFIQTNEIWLRVLSRILLVPLIAGTSYEIIRFAGRHEGRLVNLISAPGMWLQRVTTAEPDDGQIEVAVRSLERVLADEGLLVLTNGEETE